MGVFRGLLLTAILVLAAGSAPPAHAANDMDQAPAARMNMVMAPMPALYAGQADKPGAPVFTGLGDHRHPISTANPNTQRLFDQGVNLMFNFNHAEAIRSFREAARLDPDCAMCWWGMAFALGPNINMPMSADAVAPAWQALQKAKALAPKASAEERAWIDALAVRYSADPKVDRKVLDEAFAQAMGKLWRDYPDDLDAGVFYAEAMMDTQPWDFWQADGVTPKGHADEIVATLESIIAAAPNHPGALHLYIHAVEASTTPERAEAAADRLSTLMPGAGHIVHMPSHIYYRVGRYADADHANELAASIDESYIAACHAQGFYPVGYYGHNIHFLWASSEMEGRYQTSIDAARRLVKALDSFPTAKTWPQTELYLFTPVATLLRFGKWNAILSEPMPPPAMKIDTAVSLYAHGFALANTGDMAGAEADRANLSNLVDSDFTVYDRVNLPARLMAKLALALLEGEIARKSGHPAEAIAQFKTAAALEGALPYYEPPYWHQPVSHILGAALLDAGRPAEAEAVYTESLKIYRRDGLALLGLSQALTAQGKTDKAADAKRRFYAAWARADVTPATSRF